MTSRSPFDGLSLNIDAPAAVDQRLFGGKPQAMQAPSQEPGREVSQEATNPPSQPRGQEGGRTLSLVEEPLRKNSFLFTTGEWEAMEDLLLDLRRKHSLDVTKNDLARCAVHLLVEDYEHRNEASLVVKKLRGK